MFFNRKNTNLFFKFTLLFLFLFLLKIIPFNTGFEDSIDYLNNISFPISSHFKLNKDNKLKFKSSSSCLNDTLNKYKSHLNFINSHNKAIKAKNDFIKLSDEEISSYSMLSYNEKISLLNNTNYSLEDRIHIFLGSDLENFSLVYYNISTKEKVSINENKEFKPASTYKLGLNALIYNLSLNGKLNLNDTITFENCDYEDGTGLLCSKSSIGTYTIQELLDLSIIYSDNIASNMLTRYLG
ncbi:serine hydrolase, partial [Clostridium disporicum]